MAGAGLLGLLALPVPNFYSSCGYWAGCISGLTQFRSSSYATPHDARAKQAPCCILSAASRRSARPSYENVRP
jgi:hypothetical protein